jgi:hypothetical protein
MAIAYAACEGGRFRIPVAAGTREEAPVRFVIRCRLLAASGNQGRGCHRRRPAVRPSQSPAQFKQLAGEQGEDRTEDGAGILRHSKIQTTLDLYTQEDSDEARAAQGQFLDALMTSGAVQ